MVVGDGEEKRIRTGDRDPGVGRLGQSGLESSRRGSGRRGSLRLLPMECSVAARARERVSMRDGRATGRTDPREVDDLDPRVRLDDFQDPLSPKTAQDVVNVATNEGVVHNCRAVVCEGRKPSIAEARTDGARRTSQDLLGFMHVTPLIRRDKIRHSHDFSVILVPVRGKGDPSGGQASMRRLRDARLGLLRVEGVDGTVHEHMR